MTLGQKLARLRTLEGFARGLNRELTQTEVSRGIREMGGQLSQSYLSQLENGSRPHMTATTRALLARFFRVHPGHLVDDSGDMPAHLPARSRRDIDEQLDLWLVDGSEEFGKDPELRRALIAIAKHERSRDCLILVASIVENRALVERLLSTLVPPEAPLKVRRRAGRKEV